jgi:hypothetical protein
VTEYAKLVHKMSAKNGTTELQEEPFQDLLFLFRNWPNSEEIPYGLEGGTSYILSQLEVREDADETSREIRGMIKEAYKNIHGYLLPHPGEMVAGRKIYSGHWGAMEDDFHEHYFALIEWMFKQENIVKKKVLGRELTGREYYTYVMAYCDIYSSETFPESPDLYNITVDSQNKVLIDEAFVIYANAMRPYETMNVTIESSNFNATFLKIHETNKMAAVEHFKNQPKLGTTDTEAHYEQKLKEMLDKYFETRKTKTAAFYNSYLEIQRNTNATIDKFTSEKQEEIRETMRKHGESIKEMKGTIDDATQQLEQDRQNHETRMDEQQKRLREIQNQQQKSMLEHESKIQAQKQTFDDQIDEMNANRTREETRRNENDRVRAAEFQRTIDEMIKNGQRNTEAYNAKMKEHKDMMKKERLERNRQESIQNQEMERLRSERRATEDRIRDKMAKDKREQEKQKDEIEEQIKEINRQRQETFENNLKRLEDIKQAILIAVQENEDNLQKIKKSGFEQIRKIKAELERKRQDEIKIENDRIVRAQANFRYNGAAGCVPNMFFVCAVVGILLIFVTNKML